MRRIAAAGATVAMLFSMLMGSGVAAAAVGRPAVERVSFTPRHDGMGYVVRIHTTERVAAYSRPRLVGSSELQLILFNTRLARSYRHAAPEGPVEGYREELEGGHLVLYFDVGARAHVYASAYPDRSSDDLLMSLSYEREARELLPMPVRPISATTRPLPAAEAKPQRHAAGLKAESERWRLDTIVIDAGHGGHDPGAIANGVREKDVVLDVAKRVGTYLEENLGVNVVYTRQSDRFIELKERGSIANRAGGKLFISIHANKFKNAYARGTETYFLGLHRTSEARAVMERENQVVELESNPDQYQHVTEEAIIRQTLAQSAYMKKSEQLAALVEQQFAGRVGRTSRGVKQAGFYVLWGASMPAILVELGFLSNPSEASFLDSESGKAYMASAIFRAVRDYKDLYEKGLITSAR